jgi:hypothetical protein
VNSAPAPPGIRRVTHPHSRSARVRSRRYACRSAIPIPLQNPRKRWLHWGLCNPCGHPVQFAYGVMNEDSRLATGRDGGPPRQRGSIGLRCVDRRSQPAQSRCTPSVSLGRLPWRSGRRGRAQRRRKVAAIVPGACAGGRGPSAPGPLRPQGPACGVLPCQWRARSDIWAGWNGRPVCLRSFSGSPPLCFRPAARRA